MATRAGLILRFTARRHAGRFGGWASLPWLLWLLCSAYAAPAHAASADENCAQCHASYVERWQKSVMASGAEAVQRQLCAPAWRIKRANSGPPRLFARYAIRDADGPAPMVGSSSYKLLMEAMVGAFPARYPQQLHAIPAVHGHSDDEAGTNCHQCHDADVPATTQVGCTSCHVPGATAPGAQRAGEPAHDFSTITLETCFSCHSDPRQDGNNATGDAHVHYGDMHGAGGTGLLCQDCHTSIEMHGDGNIAASSQAQLEVRCEDCHGTLEQLPWELPLAGLETAYAGPARGVANETSTIAERAAPAGDGYLLTSRGNPFGNVVRDGDRVILHASSGSVYEVSLLKQMAEHDSWSTTIARQAKRPGSGHERMACVECHADWMPTCTGCHAGEP